MKGRNKMKIYLTDAREIRDLDTDEILFACGTKAFIMTPTWMRIR